MSRLKKGLALVLTLCMMLSLMPVITPSAAAAGDEDFTRVFSLDCGRKYFSVSQIKGIIDNLAENNYTHLQLAFGNDGLRFLLDDMSVTANGTTYSSDRVKAGIQAGNEAYYNDRNGNALTETEMDTIVTYAETNGIEIIPLLNSPGHMDAILDCMESVGISKPAYNNSARTVDVTNSAAVAFTQALVGKYIAYFAGKDCTYFNMGCDEYANDIYGSGSMGFGQLISAKQYDKFVDYVNDLAELVSDAKMTPMAFNDGIYFQSNESSGTFDSDIVIAYWTSGWNTYDPASASFLANKGHKIINTNDAWYYVLGRTSGNSYTLAKAQNGVKSTSCTDIPGSNDPSAAGSMICLWCDEPSASYSSAEVSNVAGLISTFAEKNPTYFVASNEGETDGKPDLGATNGPSNGETNGTTDSREIRLTVGQTKTDTIDGNYATAIDRDELNESIATVSAASNKQGGTTETKATSITNGTAYYIKNSAGQYLNSDAQWVSNVSSAAQWTVSTRYQSYLLKNGDNYLQCNGGEFNTTTRQNSATTWSFNSGTFSHAHYSWGGSSTHTLGDAYTVTTTEAKDVTTVTFKGVSPGTTYVTVGNVRYTIIVTDKAPDNALTGSTLQIDYRITNSTVYAENGNAGSASFATIRSSDAASNEGVSVVSVVPETAYSNYDGWLELHYWQSMRLDANHHQSGESSGNDQTGQGTTFTHVRYYNSAWQYKTADGIWHYFESKDQAVAYYMRHTSITTEITTAMKDWGYSTTDSQTPDTSSNKGQVALTVAVVYPDGSVSPVENQMYRKSTTIFNYDSNWHESGKARDIGLIVPLNNSDYTISKITVTDGARKTNKNANVWYSTDDISWNKVTNEAGSQWYDETTYWDKTIDGGTPMISGADSNIRWSAKNTAKLVLIYLEPVQKATNLNLVYWDDSVSSKIKESQIVMSYEAGQLEPTYFTALKQTSSVPAAGGTFILDDNAYVTNSNNVNQTFNKDISTIPDVAAQYKSGLYQYVSAELSADGKTMTLHYNINSDKLDKTYVLDFGLPVAVPLSDLVENPDNVTKVTVLGSDATYNATDKTIVYTPSAVMTGSTSITANVTIGGTTSKFTIGFMPATTVYYEEGFASYDGNGWTDKGSKGTSTQAASVAGSKDHYGYDAKYAGETAGPSNASQATSTEPGKTATFTFTGTGVDVYANCATNTGKLMISVYKGSSTNGTLKQIITVDTKMANGGSATQGQAVDAYNVPVASITGLTHGEYTLKITHVKASSKDDGGAVNLDGFRVYDTLGPTSSAHAQGGVYYKDLEDDPTFIELRDEVLTAQNVSTEGSVYADQIAGQVYKESNMTSAGAIILSDDQKYDAAALKDLLDNGPKNEIYLQPNQALTFKVTGDNAKRVIQVGLKALDAGTSYTINNGVQQTLNSSTDMFYKVLDKDPSRTDAQTITITNKGTGILAVTKLKICDDPNATLGTLTAEDLVPALVSLGFPTSSGYTGLGSGLPFTDVTSGDWFLDSVRYVYQKGLMNGTGSATFSPQQTTNRAMIVTILHRLENSPAADAQNPFADVAAGQYYADPVAWAAANGIVTGTSQTTFAPLNNITREQMAAILYRYAQHKGYDVSVGEDTNILSYTDAEAISEYAIPAIQWAVGAGLINGKGDGVLDPQGSATRAEVSAILARFCEAYTK